MGGVGPVPTYRSVQSLCSTYLCTEEGIIRVASSTLSRVPDKQMNFSGSTTTNRSSADVSSRDLASRTETEDNTQLSEIPTDANGTTTSTAAPERTAKNHAPCLAR